MNPKDTKRALALGMLLLIPATALCGCASTPVVVMRERPACGMGPTKPDEGKPFSVSQAQSALVGAAQAASECSLDAAKTSGRVLVSFGPAGCVAKLKLELSGPELAAADQECIANAFLAARVDEFSGHAVSVSKVLTASL
jgi:hypothetical protein